MKKLLLILFLFVTFQQAKSQIIITGIMYDPRGADAATPGSAISGSPTLPDGVTVYTHKGGYEYAQFKATQNIDFSVTPYAVVFCRNPGATTTTLENGWAAGGDRTYKFNLTSGTVAKGDFFYVGGPEKRLGGYAVENNIVYQSADISGSKWIKAVSYSNTAGDDFGSATTALLPNSGNPGGVAVFVGTAVTNVSVPLDAVFVSGVNPISSVTSVYNSANQWGYRVPNNDFYNTTDTFFGKGTNTKTFVYNSGTASALDNGSFIVLSGTFNTVTNTWDAPRTSNNLALIATNTQADASVSTLATIEGTGSTTLPVSLTTFTAKANKQGTVNLSWSTASEQNNAYFEVTRSADGVNFTKLDQIAGAGNSNTIKNYAYTDVKPFMGSTNYYRLKQVDHDGKFAYSQISSAKVGLSKNDLTVAVAANKSSITVGYNALTNGKALFTVYNVSGAKIASIAQNVSVGVNQITIPVTLGNSLHILNVSQAGAKASAKF